MKKMVVKGYAIVLSKKRHPRWKVYLETVSFHRDLPSKPMIEVRVRHDYVLDFLRRYYPEKMGFYEVLNDGRVIVPRGDLEDTIFMKTAVLACVLSTMRSDVNRDAIAETVYRLGYFETLFWYVKFLEAYEKRGLASIRRVSHAFRIMYRLGKK